MRIITGTAKGLKLKTPSGLSTRPTGDRVKESIFNILNGMTNFSEVENVLDIFAGTGALGLESVSRGARFATFIDSATAELIAENAARAKFSDACKILKSDFEPALKKLSGQKQFDLIFADPPYKKGLTEKTLKLVSELNILKTDGIIVVEHGADEIVAGVPPDLNCIRKINYGHTTAADVFCKTD